MRKFSIVIMISLIITGWLIYLTWFKDSIDSDGKTQGNNPPGEKNSADKQESSDTEGVPVEIASATVGRISSFLVFTSNVESERSVDIHAEISGLVKSIAVEEGDTVEVGDALLYLVDDERRIEEEESRLNLKYLEADFGRIEEIFNREMVTHQEYEDKKLLFEQARLRLERAELQLSRSIILAPISGIITERQVQLGARITTQDKLFHIADPEELIARVHVSERYLGVIMLDQSAVLTPGTEDAKPYTGWIKRLSPMVDTESGTFKVTIGLHPDQGFLPPGLFISVRIITETHEEAVLLPKRSIVYDGEDKYVFVVKDGIAVKSRINVGLENSRQIEVLSAFDIDTPVIVRGQNGLKDDTRVKIFVETVKQASEESETGS